MTIIRPFRSIRPSAEAAASIAALPYDVYDRAEATRVVRQNPLSFLKIDRAETQLPDDTDMYSEAVYNRARDTFREMRSDGFFIQEDSDCFYLYALTMNGRTQTGIVGCASIDDYLSGTIRKHENTRAEKEADRICHVDTLSAQTGPIFLAYRQNRKLSDIIAASKTDEASLYDFVSEDGILHQVWRISDSGICAEITRIFSEIDHIYIADGHHRAASAVRVGQKRRCAHPEFDGREEFNYFLSVLFPDSDLMIYDYNRFITGLNGFRPATLVEALKKTFSVEELPPAKETFREHFSGGTSGSSDYAKPLRKGEFSMYCGGKWYRITVPTPLYSGRPVEDLDVSILQNHLLRPLLGIEDATTDPRIRFVGGIRGLDELVRLADSSFPEDCAAFAMYPTSMEELLSVADAGALMPPKSTWFEPKLRSGLFIHEIER